MPAIHDGQTLKTFGSKMVEAVRLIPENKKDDPIWVGTFPDANGNPVEQKAQSAIVVAADATIGLHAMTQMMLEKKPGDSDYMEWIDNEIVRISKLPITEVADLMQKFLDEAAEALDSMTPEMMDETIVMEGHEFTKKFMAALIPAHLIHHRGQMFMMLRWMGVVPPRFM